MFKYMSIAEYFHGRLDPEQRLYVPGGSHMIETGTPKERCAIKVAGLSRSEVLGAFLED